jgi:hypothetical protein
MNDHLYIVIGEIEHIGQKFIGGDFSASYSREPVAAFDTYEKAAKYVESQKLKRPRKEGTYSGTAHYRGGYYDMEVESVQKFY